MDYERKRYGECSTNTSGRYGLAGITLLIEIFPISNFKDIFPQNKQFLKCFLLIKTQHLCIIWKIQAVFQLFFHSIFDAPYLME